MQKGLSRNSGVAFQRGGNWNNGSNAGAFTLNLNNSPANVNTNIGFRCAQYFSFEFVRIFEVARVKYLKNINPSQENYRFYSFPSRQNAKRENIKPLSQRSGSKAKPETSFLG